LTLLKSYYEKDVLEAGCDEAGRGCLAGPVVAAAVILPDKFDHPWLNDSKQISEKKRRELRKIIESTAITFAVGSYSNVEIDESNILRASILSMHRAIDKLSQIPEHIIVDGNKFLPYKDVPYLCIVKGDAKYKSIAAASILAKTYRDELMEDYHEDYPVYNWKRNKGYPTKEHRQAIMDHGITSLHRRSFNLLSTQLTINFQL
jgi:ribonuclease HII